MILVACDGCCRLRGLSQSHETNIAVCVPAGLRVPVVRLALSDVAVHCDKISRVQLAAWPRGLIKNISQLRSKYQSNVILQCSATFMHANFT
jgi:hypothetical protein